MKNQFSLDIKTPCSENFNSFKPTSKGGFCSSCEKEVIDFTTMNAQDIITYFKTKSGKNTCGQFKSHQLKTYTSAPKHEKRLSFFGGIGLACLSLFSFGKMQAQDREKLAGELDNSPLKSITQNLTKNIEVKGNIVAKEDNLPLPGVSVILEGSTVGVQTDFDGNFTFPEKLKKGDVLVFSFVGMDSKKIVINDSNSASKVKLQINMSWASCFVVGKVATKEIYTSNKNK